VDVGGGARIVHLRHVLYQNKSTSLLALLVPKCKNWHLRWKSGAVRG
jgi:hypothetical protein